MSGAKQIPRLVRALTWHDLLVCAALMLTPLAALLFALLDLVSAVFGGPPVRLPEGPALFFVNLAGLFGVLWNIAMLTEAAPRLHRIDLVARLGVISLILYHIVWSGLPPIFVLFVLTEASGGVAKLLWLGKGAGMAASRTD